MQSVAFINDNFPDGDHKLILFGWIPTARNSSPGVFWLHSCSKRKDCTIASFVKRGLHECFLTIPRHLLLSFYQNLTMTRLTWLNGKFKSPCLVICEQRMRISHWLNLDREFFIKVNIAWLPVCPVLLPSPRSHGNCTICHLARGRVQLQSRKRCSEVSAIFLVLLPMCLLTISSAVQDSFANRTFATIILAQIFHAVYTTLQSSFSVRFAISSGCIHDQIGDITQSHSGHAATYFKGRHPTPSMSSEVSSKLSRMTTSSDLARLWELESWRF